MHTNNEHLSRADKATVESKLSRGSVNTLMDLRRANECGCGKLAITIGQEGASSSNGRAALIETDQESLRAYLAVLWDITDIFEDLTHLAKSERIAHLERLKKITNDNYVLVDGSFVS